MKILFVINPMAGGVNHEKTILALEETVKAQGYDAGLEHKAPHLSETIRPLWPHTVTSMATATENFKKQVR